MWNKVLKKEKWVNNLLIINRAILHILDFNSGITVFSEQELDIKSDSVMTFLTKHLERCYHDQKAQSGTFYPNSKFKEQLSDYLADSLDFINFSTYVAELMYSAISQSDVFNSADLLICDFMVDDQRFIAILKCNNRPGFTHQVINENEKVKNEIISHYAILPNLSQKIDEYAFIEADSLAIHFIDKKCSINGTDSEIFADIVLECSARVSPQDTIKLVNSITRTVAENHGQSSIAAVSKAKNYLVENTEVSDYLDPVELGREVFSSSPSMQEEYLQEVKSAGIAETVKMDKEFALRKGKNHKIKTDTGIEVSFPAGYFQNTDYIEIINNPDGTLSIELKNIGKITNK